jgi:hypothetical protein
VTISNSSAGAWWQVDLGQSTAVKKVVIYNRNDCTGCQRRLSNSNVTLRDANDNVLASYRIGDASLLNEIEIDAYMFSSISDTWKFNTELQTIESLGCPGMYVTVASVQSIGSWAKRFTVFLPEFSNVTKNDQVKNEVANFNNSLPGVGSPVTLSNNTVGQYQSWNQKYQRFQNIQGPFSITNLNRISFDVGSGLCPHGMPLKSVTDDYSSPSQQFYLGDNGQIISSKCPGLVVAMGNSSSAPLSLQTYQIDKDEAKWILRGDGRIESVKIPGMVISAGSSSLPIITEQSQNPTNLNQVWSQRNVRLVSSSVPSGIQDWFVSFVEPGFGARDLTELGITSNATKCYESSPAFNRAFEDFASGINIPDAYDEEKCGRAREQLGFDADHPFDVEICDKYQYYMCDIHFTGIDHLSAAPPKFEAVKFKEANYKTVNYEAPE